MVRIIPRLEDKFYTGSDREGEASTSNPTIILYNGAGIVCLLRRSCTSGYKHETFGLCSSNLSCKNFLVSHRKFFHFQDG